MTDDERRWRRDETAANHHIGPVHGPPRERGQGWERVRDELVRALTTEPLDPDEIAGLAETLDILLTPGAAEDIEESRAEDEAGLAIDGPTALAKFRADLRAADEQIAAGNLGTPLADVMAELDAESGCPECGSFAALADDARAWRARRRESAQ